MITEIRNRHGERLDYTFTPGDGDSGATRGKIVVVGHGVTSHKERPWLIALCDALARAGLASLRFSFAGNGDSEGRYEDATISKEVDDLGSVIDALDGWTVAYAGHSMGGAVGLLRTADDPRIRAFVSLAGMVHVRKFMQRHFGHLVPGRDVLLDKPHCPLTQEFLDDATRVDTLTGKASGVQVPWLLVHGTADELVPFQDSVDVRAAAGGRPELVALDGVDHRFSNHEQAMAAAVVPWLLANL